MPEPTLTLEDVITRYQKEGIDDDGIYTRLKSRGIDLDTIGENAGLTKVRMTVGEFVDDAIAGQASGEAIRANMIRRGIINADNLTDEDFDRPFVLQNPELAGLRLLPFVWDLSPHLAQALADYPACF